MSKGMYCSASQWIDSASSSGLICGRLIFLTMTALPETLVATSAVLIFWAGEEPLDRVDDGAGVHDGAVDDGLGRQRLDPDVHELVLVAALAAGLQLHGLDGRRADVEADQSFLLAEQSHGRLSRYRRRSSDCAHLAAPTRRASDSIRTEIEIHTYEE